MKFINVYLNLLEVVSLKSPFSTIILLSKSIYINLFKTTFFLDLSVISCQVATKNIFLCYYSIKVILYIYEFLIMTCKINKTEILFKLNIIWSLYLFPQLSFLPLGSLKEYQYYNLNHKLKYYG